MVAAVGHRRCMCIRILAAVAAFTITLGVAEGAHAQIQRLPSGGSPEECLAGYLGQGLNLNEALDNCAPDLAGGHGGLSAGGGSAGTSASAPPTSCAPSGG